MTGGMYVTLNFLITFGPPLALCWMPMRSSGGDPDRRKQPEPAPVAPTAPSPVTPVMRPLPDCLVPQPALGAVETGRELEPV